MPSVSIELVLMLGYAVFLALIALSLELAARHAHRRTLAMRTAGFTYHPERDIWRCPEEQHLFPVFSDTPKGLTVYRAPAAACNSCRSKAACTDSETGREIERRNLIGVQYGMQRFHRALSLTLMILSSLILAVEILREPHPLPRTIVAGVFILFCTVVWRLAVTLLEDRRTSMAMQSSSGYFDNPRRTSGSPSS